MTALVGTGALVRLALRRDRLILPPWIAAIAVLSLATAAAFARLYPTAASRLPFALGVADNPALRALVGPPFDLGSIGGLTAWRIGGVGAVLTALMTLFAVVRHTRAEEEAGRLELLRAGVLGRHAALAAALLIALGANLICAAVVAAGLIALGLPAAGALALGLALASSGCLFGAVAAVAAQVSERARVANGIAGGAVGLAYLVRAAGDSGPGWLSWLSPIGWTQQVRPFAGERWGPLALTLAVAILLAALAHVMVARRDTGAGLFAPSPGPAAAAPSLRSAWALAWRIHRGGLVGWSVGFAAAGTLFGTVAESIADIVRASSRLQLLLRAVGGARRVVDGFFAGTMIVTGFLAAAYTVQAVLRLRAEETAGRVEPILATTAGRTRWALGHLVLAALGPALLLLVLGIFEGTAHGLAIGAVSVEIPRLVAAAFIQLPAAWVLGALALALFGLAPRQTAASWAALMVFFLLGQLGPLLELPAWVTGLSPFAHVPRLPGPPPELAPLVGLVAVAGALAAAGLAGFRRRDVG